MGICDCCVFFDNIDLGWVGDWSPFGVIENSIPVTNAYDQMFKI
jgi:hypothetical protein